MFVIEKREYRFEDKYDWDDEQSYIRREDGSLIAYETLDKAVAACHTIAFDRYNKDWTFYQEPDGWDITDFPSNPVLNEWYTIGEFYSITRYLRIVEVRV